MKRNPSSAIQTAWNAPPIAVLWDQSLLWGLICVQTLQRLGVPHELLSGSGIARGDLQFHRVLLVPGGWAAHKIRALGRTGRNQIGRFIRRGGSYLGFCGGAGMALSSPPSLELVPLERMPLSERLPNASGTVLIRGVADHPAWRDLPEEIPVSIWWPSQFAWQPLPRSLCLGVYAAPGEDFWVADLPLADFTGGQEEWRNREQIYGINLDPRRLLGQPAILEVNLGRGRLILSYPHLETPQDELGNQLLVHVLHYLDDTAAVHLGAIAARASRPAAHTAGPGRESLQRFAAVQEVVSDLIAFGERHLLWYWGSPWLLRWQRGIRGLEYTMLAVTTRFLAELGAVAADPASASTADPWEEPARKLENEVREFCTQAKRLLLEEKLAAHMGSLSKLGQVNERVDALRAFLFGNRMNHGGLCRSIFDQLDHLLLPLLRSSRSKHSILP